MVCQQFFGSIRGFHFLVFAAVICSIFYVEGTSAQECYPRNIDYPRFHIDVDSQEDLDEMAQTCKTFHGSIYIAENYTGPFVLRGVANVTEGIHLFGYENDKITSIELPDLVSLRELTGTVSNSFRSISMPNLTSVEKIELYGGSNATFITPVLKNGTSIEIFGNYTSIDFSQLERLEERLTVCSRGRCSLGSGTLLNVSFPKLEMANGVSVVGNLSGLSMPMLSTAGGRPYIYHLGRNDAGIYVGNAGEPLSVSLPRLSTVISTTNITGNIDSISLPALRDTNSSIKIDSYTPLNLSLPSLVRVNQVWAEGNISGFSLPALKRSERISIDSALPIDCEKLYKRILGNYDHPRVIAWGCRSSKDDETRDRPKSSYDQTFSSGTAVGVGTGVGLFVLLVIAISIVFWDKRKRRKKTSREQAAVQVYELRAEQGGGQQLERPRTPPPPYSPR